MPYSGRDFRIFRRVDFEAAFPDINPEAAGLQPLPFSGENDNESSLLFYGQNFDDGGDVLMSDVVAEQIRRGYITQEQADCLLLEIDQIPSAYIDNYA